MDEHGLSYEQMSERKAELSAKEKELTAKIAEAQNRLAEVNVLKNHIINYAKTKDVYTQQDYIISIVRNNSSDRKVPTALGSKLYLDFSDDEQYVTRYQELLERIYGEDSKKKPSLGKNPFSNEIGQQIELKTKLESIKYHSPSMDGTVTFCYDNNNGIYIIGNGDYAFETRWSRSGNNSIHAYGLIGFKNGTVNFPELSELYSYDFSSRSRTIRTGQVVIFENMNSHFAAIKLGEVKSSSHGNLYDKMTFEYHIYSAT